MVFCLIDLHLNENQVHQPKFPIDWLRWKRKVSRWVLRPQNHDTLQLGEFILAGVNGPQILLFPNSILQIWNYDQAYYANFELDFIVLWILFPYVVCILLHYDVLRLRYQFRICTSRRYGGSWRLNPIKESIQRNFYCLILHLNL